MELGDINWGVVFTLGGLLWTCIQLALIERMRRTFATPENIKAELKEFEADLRDNLVSRAELDGLGAKVGNLHHMFTATQRIAEEAKDRAREAQGDIKHLSARVEQCFALTSEVSRKLDTMVQGLSELKGEIRASQRQHAADR